MTISSLHTSADKAIDLATNETVVLKKMRIENAKHGLPITTMREITILLACDHENVVKLKEIVVGQYNAIFLVMEYCENDLVSVEKQFNESETKCIMIQLFKGLHYLHSNYYIHRDLKLSNLLINHRGLLKIADFGLARKFGYPLKAMTPNVVTLWYRAPELLLNSKYQTVGIDIWASGCVFGELLSDRPVFPGKSEIEQLNLIVEMLGTPNDQIWPGVMNLPFFNTFTLKKQPYNNLKNKFGYLSETGLELMNNLFTYDPKKRITAEKALDCSYFKEKPYRKPSSSMIRFDG